mgnify:CR=1 FL=1
MTEKLMETFQNLFGADGDIRTYFAPGRVNLIGEHTDYNGGHVFPCALTLGTYAVARKRDDRVLRFYSENFASLGVIETSLDDLVPDEKADWTNYPKGCGHSRNAATNFRREWTLLFTVIFQTVPDCPLLLPWKY